jgi:hypothetical protein
MNSPRALKSRVGEVCREELEEKREESLFWISRGINGLSVDSSGCILPYFSMLLADRRLLIREPAACVTD